MGQFVPEWAHLCWKMAPINFWWNSTPFLCKYNLSGSITDKVKCHLSTVQDPVCPPPLNQNRFFSRSGIVRGWYIRITQINICFSKISHKIKPENVSKNPKIKLNTNTIAYRLVIGLSRHPRTTPTHRTQTFVRIRASHASAHESFTHTYSYIALVKQKKILK